PVYPRRGTIGPSAEVPGEYVTDGADGTPEFGKLVMNAAQRTSEDRSSTSFGFYLNFEPRGVRADAARAHEAAYSSDREPSDHADPPYAKLAARRKGLGWVPDADLDSSVATMLVDLGPRLC